MAKGAESKSFIFNKLQEVFAGAFMQDSKTLRIPLTENGEPIEIKVTLTAAKDILGGGSAEAGTEISQVDMGDSAGISSFEVEPTEEEKANVANLLSQLGL